MSGEQYSGRLQVLDSPTVWSECMCDRKNSRAPPARRTLQKSTAMGVPGITVPFMAPGCGERADDGNAPAAFPPNSARGTAHAREGRGGACAVRGGAERAAMPYLGGEEALRDLRRALSNPHVQAEPLRYRAAVLRVIRCGAVRCGGRRRRRREGGQRRAGVG